MTTTIDTPLAQPGQPGFTLPGNHGAHVAWLQQQYALTRDSAEAEAMDRYRKYSSELTRWSNARAMVTDGRMLDAAQKQLATAPTSDTELQRLNSDLVTQVRRLEQELETVNAGKRETARELGRARETIGMHQRNSDARLAEMKTQAEELGTHQRASDARLDELNQVRERLATEQRVSEDRLTEVRLLETELAAAQQHRSEADALMQQEQAAARGHKSAADELATQVDHLRATNSQRMQNHRQDIQTISERLKQEAEERNWCEEYDEIVESVNRDLHVELETRHKEFCVTVHYCVTALDEDSAAELVSDMSVSDSTDIHVEEA